MTIRMRMTRRMLAAAIGVAGLTVSLPPAAGAFDMKGEWAGKVKCTERTTTIAKRKGTLEGTLEIAQIGTGIGMRLTLPGILRTYSGTAVFDVTKPEKLGDAAFTACGTDDSFTQAGFDELGRFQVLADLIRGKGRLKGVSNYVLDGTTIGTCQWRFKWTSIVDPPALGTTCG